MADDKKEAKAPKGDAPKADAGAKAEGAKSEGAKAAAKGGKPGAKKAKGAGGLSGPVQADRPRGPKVPPRLATFYLEKVRPELVKKFGFKSVMQAPRFEKIVINMGVGDAIQDQKLLDAALNEMALIAGQKPALRRAKKAISNFKLRAGVPVGCCVTLRGARMYEFYDRLVNVAIPRIRDFRGLNPRSFDGRGNYTMGVTEQIIFPEINYDKVGKIRGMDVTIVTSAKNDEEGRELLRQMQLPFRQR
jgi:large subunit ribosomal protein L5